MVSSLTILKWSVDYGEELSTEEAPLHIGLTLKKLVNLYKRHVVEVHSEIPSICHVTLVQGWVICFIFEQSKAKDIFQRDIEIELDIRKSSATTLLQRMEKNGLIKREPLFHDARWKRLVLTEKAIEFHKELEKRMIQVESQALKGLCENDLNHFLNIANIIAKNLESESIILADELII